MSAPKEKSEVDFNIAIEDDKYDLVVYNKEGVVIEQSSGTVRYVPMQDNEGKVIKALAVLENVECRSFYADVVYQYEFNTARSNLMLYVAEDGEIILKDSLSVGNRATGVQFTKAYELE